MGVIDRLRRLRLQFEDWRLRRMSDDEIRRRLRFEPGWTVPPGDTLLELMAERRMLFSDLARLMLEDETRVQRILAGVEPVTISDALTFEEVFGVSADFWMNMERRYREDLARGARRSVT